jgi:hypothetical protein
MGVCDTSRTDPRITKATQHTTLRLAHGTPFTRAPLTCLNWEADSPEAEELVAGKTPEAFTGIDNKYLQDFINYIRDMPQLPEIDC